MCNIENLVALAWMEGLETGIRETAQSILSSEAFDVLCSDDDNHSRKANGVTQ